MWRNSGGGGGEHICIAPWAMATYTEDACDTGLCDPIPAPGPPPLGHVTVAEGERRPAGSGPCSAIRPPSSSHVTPCSSKRPALSCGPSLLKPPILQPENPPWVFTEKEEHLLTCFPDSNIVAGPSHGEGREHGIWQQTAPEVRGFKCYTVTSDFGRVTQNSLEPGFFV